VQRAGTSTVGDELEEKWCDELCLYTKCAPHQNLAALYYTCHEQSPWMAVYECSQNVRPHVLAR